MHQYKMPLQYALIRNESPTRQQCPRLKTITLAKFSYRLLKVRLNPRCPKEINNIASKMCFSVHVKHQLMLEEDWENVVQTQRKSDTYLKIR